MDCAAILEVFAQRHRVAAVTYDPHRSALSLRFSQAVREEDLKPDLERTVELLRRHCDQLA
ncbi:MAG: hypothetical protein NZL87_00660, partial [Thermomicrobium sp.]|nr:hypothetical protein [Thermomicrobium sp.]